MESWIRGSEELPHKNPVSASLYSSESDQEAFLIQLESFADLIELNSALLQDYKTILTGL